MLGCSSRVSTDIKIEVESWCFGAGLVRLDSGTASLSWTERLMYLSDRVYSLGMDEAGQFAEFALLA